MKDETNFIKDLTQKELQLFEDMLEAKYQEGYEDGYQAASYEIKERKAE